jgi:hypothetical protein
LDISRAAYRESRTPPASRLALDAYYPAMPPDARHHYLNLPLDYGDSASALFRDFYIVSPHFQASGPVVFFLTDGQMELVSPSPDFAFFEAELPGLSYVLIGHRGHAPTLFPEVYRNGNADLRRVSRRSISCRSGGASARAGPGIPDGCSLGVLRSWPACTGYRSTACHSAVN